VKTGLPQMDLDATGDTPRTHQAFAEFLTRIDNA
jgi:hypothetical protein